MGGKMRVLVISYMSWRNDNNSGNTFSNLFEGLEDDVEFAHIYCRDSKPLNSVCHRYFQIPEHDIMPGRGRKEDIGKAFYVERPDESERESFSASYNKMRTMRWNVFYFARDVLWDLAKWRTPQLDAFVEDFKPDIVFGNLTNMPIIHKIMGYVCDRWDVPLVFFCWDDVYLLSKRSLSPFYWAMRLTQRKWIRKSVSRASVLYAITKEMADEYGTALGKSFSVLTKGHDFGERPGYEGPRGTVRYVYAGNIGAGRWKTLARLASVLQKDGGRGELDIYTLTPVDDAMRTQLEIDGVSHLCGAAAPSDLPAIHAAADVLVAVEPTVENERRQCRLSFSTKLVDYFQAGRCLLSVGGPTASTEYLAREDAAIVAYDEGELERAVTDIGSNPALLREYARKAWDCGVRNHQKSDIQERLLADFCAAIENKRR